MKLPRPSVIPEWRSCLRFDSVRAALLLALLSAVQADVLPLVAPLFPPSVWPWVSGGIALAIVLLRLRKQQLPGRDGAPDTHPAPHNPSN